MPGEWIPMSCGLHERREVVLIAADCRISVDEVVGRLHRFWSWAGHETSTGRLPGVTCETLGALFGWDVSFWRAMARAGWLTLGEGFVSVPRFGKWLGGSAKARVQRNIRQARWRRARDGRVDAPASTGASTRLEEIKGEERREEETPSESLARSVADNASEPSPPEPVAPAAPSFMSFPLPGAGGEWDLAQSKRDEYAESFPGVDVDGELRKARQWLRDNPTKRKTARGMTRFLGTWLGKAQDRASVAVVNGSARTWAGARPVMPVGAGAIPGAGNPGGSETPAEFRERMLVRAKEMGL